MGPRQPNRDYRDPWGDKAIESFGMKAGVSGKDSNPCARARRPQGRVPSHRTGSLDSFGPLADSEPVAGSGFVLFNKRLRVGR
jgi:hypothetical protein